MKIDHGLAMDMNMNILIGVRAQQIIKIILIIAKKSYKGTSKN